MQIKADEISKILREQIKDYRAGVLESEIGTVISVGDGIARIHGLDNAMAGELLDFPHGVKGIYIQSCTLSATMSPPVRVDVKEFVAV